MILPIVVVAFNRANSLKRLLHSLDEANYTGVNSVPLIISIDKSPSNRDVLKVAEDFKWNYGDKEIRYQEKNLGLREHVIKCGKISQEFGGVIILEDDLFVSPNFYRYALESLSFCATNDKIGGISLFSHKLNVHNNYPFDIYQEGYDNFYLQFASSWGQLWSDKQFTEFLGWYESEARTLNENLPPYVKQWSSKSWLKYFISYLIETNRYFFYPTVSLTTNFGDQGTHQEKNSNAFQVPISYATNKQEFRFVDLSDSKSVYDANFENIFIAEALGLDRKDTIIDLNGTLPLTTDKSKKHLISSRRWNYEIVQTFARSMRPIESNIFHQQPGSELFLYNLQKKKRNPYKTRIEDEFSYHFKNITHRRSYEIFKAMTLARFFRK